MRKLIPILFLACLPLAAADLSGLQPVYFWPMESALDQYLAERAQAAGALSVTVDPLLAKSIMTDRIDADFLKAMDELFPVAGREDDGEENESVEEGGLTKRVFNRPQGRPHGTLFLVDVKSRRVTWSTFIGEFERSPKALHKEAKTIIARLQTGE